MSNKQYYIISSSFHESDGMMVGNMPDLPDEMEDDWMFGLPFSIEPEQPIFVGIQEGNEKCTPLPFYRSPPIASNAFIDALIEAGVDNIVTYDVVLKSRVDSSITVEGYKAINIIGLVNSVKDNTIALTGSTEESVAINQITIDPTSDKGLSLFRLAKSMRTIVVNQKVKLHLESKGFVGLVFTEQSEALIL